MRVSRPRWVTTARRYLTNRTILLFAFAFAVIADPVSSVAYAIEAALRALNGDLALLVPTMTLVLVIIILVIVNYHQLVGRYPQGGGAAAATGEAFGEASAFIPIGALIVDFVLTGVEAPSSAIAQLGQLDDRGRRRFGRITLWLTLGVVGILTMGLTAQAVHLRIGIPGDNSTQIDELARAATSPPIYAAFQLATALLLLSAASSSFQAGPGLFKALARQRCHDGTSAGILPEWLGRTNVHHTPYWGVVLFMLAGIGLWAMPRSRNGIKKAMNTPATRPNKGPIMTPTNAYVAPSKTFAAA
jgi:amino acid transporter